MNGDLLRTLEGPESCLKPKLIQASREGHCVIFYDSGFFCTFSVNGKLQATVETDDNIRVSALQTVQQSRFLPPSVTSEEGETSVELLSLFSTQEKTKQKTIVRERVEAACTPHGPWHVPSCADRIAQPEYSVHDITQ